MAHDEARFGPPRRPYRLLRSSTVSLASSKSARAFGCSPFPLYSHDPVLYKKYLSYCSQPTGEGDITSSATVQLPNTPNDAD